MLDRYKSKPTSARNMRCLIILAFFCNRLVESASNRTSRYALHHSPKMMQIIGDQGREAEVVSFQGENMYALADDHPSFRWRRIAGRKSPPVGVAMDRVLLWTLHDRVGIGNALGGISQALMAALQKDQTLVVDSCIIQKFCELVVCSLKRIANPGVGDGSNGGHGSENSSVLLKGDITRTDVGLISTSGDKSDLSSLMGPFFRAVGCGSYRAEDENDLDWPKRCMYAEIVKSLIVDRSSSSQAEARLATRDKTADKTGIRGGGGSGGGGGGRLAAEKDWLRQFYVGDSGRFDAVVDISNRSVPVFDATMHVRTLHLIEDPKTKDGRPVDQEALTSAFLSSPELQHMVSCFAQEFSGHILEDEKKVKKSSGGKDKKRHHSAKDLSSSSSKGTGTGGSGGGSPHAPKQLRVFLATDSGELRAAFAKMLVAATEAALNGEKGLGKGPPLTPSPETLTVETKAWEVSVDYFTSGLPPVHYRAWTSAMEEMTEADWRGLTGTTAEWLFLARGHRMYTAKGVRGGERARPSSFSLSAAAFGGTPLVTQLVTAQPRPSSKAPTGVDPVGVSVALCKWREVASF